MKKDFTMNGIEHRTRQFFENGFFCAESVLKTIAVENKMDAPVLSAIATGFCGGMSRNAHMCGAVTGGIMGLGLVFGRYDCKDSTQRCYEAVNQFLAGFKKAHGSLNCKDLTGYDLGIPEQLERFRQENPGYEKCIGFSLKAASLVQAIIDQSSHKQG